MIQITMPSRHNPNWINLGQGNSGVEKIILMMNYFIINNI